MRLRSFVALALVIPALSLGVAEEIKVTSEKPVQQADEEIIIVTNSFPSCARLAELYFCLAHGTRIRSCFVELELRKDFVVANYKDVGGGWYSSNECSAQAQIGRFLCRNGLESAHFNKMTCYSKKRNF